MNLNSNIIAPHKNVFQFYKKKVTENVESWNLGSFAYKALIIYK